MADQATRTKLDELRVKAAWKYVIFRIKLRNATERWTR
jgi:hypothetical protein